MTSWYGRKSNVNRKLNQHFFFQVRVAELVLVNVLSKEVAFRILRITLVVIWRSQWSCEREVTLLCARTKKIKSDITEDPKLITDITVHNDIYHKFLLISFAINLRSETSRLRLDFLSFFSRRLLISLLSYLQNSPLFCSFLVK